MTECAGCLLPDVDLIIARAPSALGTATGELQA